MRRRSRREIKKKGEDMVLVLQLFLLRQLYFFFFLWVSQSLAAAAEPLMVKAGCQEKCGEVTIPYPFGFQPGCYKDDWYAITCNSSSSKPFYSNLEILSISVPQGYMRLQNWIAYSCFNESGHFTVGSETSVQLGGAESPFSFSDQNLFTAVGCNTVGLMKGSVGREFTTGCISYCEKQESVGNKSCSGIGCCQTPIPKGTKMFEFSTSRQYDNNNVTFNRCSYGFLADKDRYNFSLPDVTDPHEDFLDRITKNVPIVIDWTISDNRSCGANSHITNAPDRPDYYLCNCNPGYHGNPYLDSGCEDIDECASANDCTENACQNTGGGYKCVCPEGFYGDGKGKGTGCKANQAFPVTKVIIGLVSALVVLVLSGFWLFWKKRRLMKLKEKFFKQNGGLLLQQQLSSHQGITETTKIFNVEELVRATNNFNENQILGKGGYGTVYKGILSDNRVVAIKKSKLVDENQIEQFINEVAILTQINHRNVVKLLGCCLETEVPLLVYEYIPNGTLFEHIHGEGDSSSISWDNRLRIATETAEALAYLHSSASIPIFHRDVKSTNILLDDNYTAKVSDFGASRLVPMDKTQVTTLVQGTLGYLDPEYLHTSQLTDKSDVYSFGVVLVELLTGQLALSFDRPENERNLTMHFLSSMKNNRLVEILEARVIDEGTTELLGAVAELAMRCLRVKGDERPTMKEVASELQGLRRSEKHPWVFQNIEESESLLGEASSSLSYKGITIGYDSLRNQEMITLNIPR